MTTPNNVARYFKYQKEVNVCEKAQDQQLNIKLSQPKESQSTTGEHTKMSRAK